MYLYNRIEQLCDKKGISITTMCRESGTSRGSLGDLKSGKIQTLSSETLKKISDYFGVTIDYLLGNEKTPIADDNGRITNELIDLLSDVSEERIEKILQYIQLFDKIPDDKIPQALEFLEYLSKSK